MYQRQQLPLPWQPAATRIPLVVYGASSALGCFCIKLAKLSNIHPIIAICGSSKSYVESLLIPEEGDKIVDYRQGEAAWTSAVKSALDGLPCFHGIDCISSNKSWCAVASVLSSSADVKATLSVTSGAHKYDDVGAGVNVLYTFVGSAHEGSYRPAMPKQPPQVQVKGDPWFGFVFFRFVSLLLAQGGFSGHPWEVIDGGLGGVEKGLRRLKDGRAGGKKLVYW